MVSTLDLNAQSRRHQMPVPVPCGTDQTGTAASNAAVVLTFAANPTRPYLLFEVSWSYSGDPTGGSLKVEDGSGNTVRQWDITKGGPGILRFAQPLQLTPNTALIITLAAGGTGIVGKLNALAALLN